MKQLLQIRNLPILGVLIFSLFLACDNAVDGDRDEEMRSLSEILQVGQQRAVNRQNIDWDALTQQVNDTYATDGFDAAVMVFLTALGDNQSFYGRFNGNNIFAGQANCSSTGYTFADLPDDIGYIQMRSFVGNQIQATLFAGDRHNRARTQDNANLRGWVVDLTTTDGGEIYAQIAALGMFFDREILGYFTNVDEEIPWGYLDGQAFVRNSGEPQASVDDPYTLIDPDAKLVVVTDLVTAGAGEAAVIALRNRPNTLILGRPTCGLATVTQSFSLSNSDALVLATHYIADSEREIFNTRIQPDEQVGNSVELIQRIEAFMN